MIPIFFFFSLIPAYYLGRPEFNNNTLQALIFFMPAYLIGMIMEEKPFLYKSIADKSILYLLGALIIFVAASLNLGLNSSNDLLAKIIISILTMSVCYKYLNTSNIVLDLFTRLSFFLFFIHGYFIAIFRISFDHFHISGDNILVVIGIFMITIIGSLTSFFFAKLILRKYSKYFIGA